MTNYIKTTPTLDSYNLITAGVELGFDHYTVCTMLSDDELYAQDGDGYFYIYHSSQEDYGLNPDMQRIIDAILDAANLTEVKVIQ